MEGKAEYFRCDPCSGHRADSLAGPGPTTHPKLLYHECISPSGFLGTGHSYNAGGPTAHANPNAFQSGRSARTCPWGGNSPDNGSFRGSGGPSSESERPNPPGPSSSLSTACWS